MEAGRRIVLSRARASSAHAPLRPRAQATITRTKDEALQLLREYEAQLRATSAAELPSKFAELAALHSDCSSAKKGGATSLDSRARSLSLSLCFAHVFSPVGDLGTFGPGQMQKPFEDAVVATKVGQLSGIVDTDSGVHIILRTK